MAEDLFCFKFQKTKLFALSEDLGREVVFVFLTEQSAETFLEEVLVWGADLDPSFFVLTGKKEHAMLNKYEVVEDPIIKFIATESYPPTIILSS